mmetsp:Transcript_7263/g.9489  ORF Transcript_7263/g.9489 Transcript_7263/m.9489 type:complete len:175 (+) Transcript_7263:485-1009(+)
MVLVWSVYAVLLVAFFKEPDIKRTFEATHVHYPNNYSECEKTDESDESSDKENLESEPLLRRTKHENYETLPLVGDKAKLNRQFVEPNHGVSSGKLRSYSLSKKYDLGGCSSTMAGWNLPLDFILCKVATGSTPYVSANNYSQVLWLDTIKKWCLHGLSWNLSCPIESDALVSC